MTLQSFQLTLQRLSHKSIYCIVVHRGVSIAIRLAWLIKFLTTGMMQCPINEDGGWEHCIPYFPVRHSIKHKTDKKETPDQEKFSRSTVKFDFNLWMSILKTLQITSVCGFVQLSLFSDWPFHQMSVKIWHNGKPQDNCVRCSSHQVRNVADFK